MAFGYLGLSHEEFWGLTPFEFTELIEGYKVRDRVRKEELAWMTMHLMNATGNFKSPITIEKLLPRAFEMNDTIRAIYEESHARAIRSSNA